MSNTITLSENAQKVLDYLNKNEEGKFFGAEIAEGTFLPPRSVTGTLNGLFNKGLVDKFGDEEGKSLPKKYSITEEGKLVATNDFIYTKPTE